MAETSPPFDPIPPKVAPAHDPYAALRIGGFRWYLCGWVLSVVGQQLRFMAVAYEIYHRTGKNLPLAWVGLVQAIPLIALALPAGQLADWANRKLVVSATQFGSVICSICLAWVMWRHGTIFSMYALLFAGATMGALGGPARSALLPQIVPADKYASAVSWYSSLFQVATVAGWGIGGFLIRNGTAPAFVMDALCAGIFGVVVLTIPLTIPAAPRKAPSLASLVAGVKFVWRTKIILATITLDLFAVLLGGATILLPALSEILHVGTVGYGLLYASMGIGAFVMAILNAHLPPMKHAGRGMLWAVAGFGAATVVLGLSRNYVLSLAMLFLMGAFDNISVLVRHTLVQVLTPDEMRGRVSAVNNVFIGASNDLGAFESGLTAWLFGTITSIIAGGIGTVLVVGAVALAWPQVRRFGSLQEAVVK